MSDHRVTPTSG